MNYSNKTKKNIATLHMQLIYQLLVKPTYLTCISTLSLPLFSFLRYYAYCTRHAISIFSACIGDFYYNLLHFFLALSNLSPCHYISDVATNCSLNGFCSWVWVLSCCFYILLLPKWRCLSPIYHNKLLQVLLFPPNFKNTVIWKKMC